MATDGRDTSMGGPATRARSQKAAVTTPNPKAIDDPVVVNDAPVVENDAPVVENDAPVVENDAPVVKGRDPGVKRDDPPAETQGPDAALAASQADLAKLQAIRRARVIKAIALTAIALVLIVFVLQNADPVGVNILWGTVSVRLIWVIVASVLLGAVAGYLVGRPDNGLRLHGPNRRQKDPR